MLMSCSRTSSSRDSLASFEDATRATSGPSIRQMPTSMAIGTPVLVEGRLHQRLQRAPCSANGVTTDRALAGWAGRPSRTPERCNASRPVPNGKDKPGLSLGAERDVRVRHRMDQCAPANARSESTPPSVSASCNTASKNRARPVCTAVKRFSNSSHTAINCSTLATIRRCSGRGGT